MEVFCDKIMLFEFKKSCKEIKKLMNRAIYGHKAKWQLLNMHIKRVYVCTHSHYVWLRPQLNIQIQTTFFFSMVEKVYH